MALMTAGDSGNLSGVYVLDTDGRKLLVGHFSAPEAASNWIDCGMFNVDYYNVPAADASTIYLTSNATNGMMELHFSGVGVSSGGYIFVIGT